jgi:hypothetical protein
MEKLSQIARKTVPLRHFFPLKVVPLIEVLLYIFPTRECVPVSSLSRGLNEQIAHVFVHSITFMMLSTGNKYCIIDQILNQLFCEIVYDTKN